MVNSTVGGVGLRVGQLNCWRLVNSAAELVPNYTSAVGHHALDFGSVLSLLYTGSLVDCIRTPHCNWVLLLQYTIVYTTKVHYTLS